MKNNKTIVLILLTTLTITSCSTAPYRPRVDMTGVAPIRYERDVLACHDQVMAAIPQRQISIVTGLAWAILGAGIGLAAASAGNIKNPAPYVAMGAGAGAIGGASFGMEEGVYAKQDYMRRCMAGRGYYVYE